MRHHVIGLGRWGSWLTERLAALGLPVVGVPGRSLELEDLRFGEADWCWLCVPDDLLPSFAASIHGLSTLPRVLLHSSGTVPSMTGTERMRTGVVWPVQSISGAQRPDWTTLPLVLQAHTTELTHELRELGSALSGRDPTVLSTDRERQLLHLGAVLTQNFGNLLWQLTDELLATDGLDYRTLLPLVTNHLERLTRERPAALQTGPAARGDFGTLAKHRELLAAVPETQRLYRELSAAIAGRNPRK